MADIAITEFFDPLIDDKLSKMILKLIDEHQTEEDYEKILEKILKLMDSGEFN